MPAAPRYYFVIFFGLLLLLLLPVWVVDRAPLPDIPVNMARAYQMHHFSDGSPAVAHMELSSYLLPNAAFDLLVPPLLGVLSLERATQCFLTLYVILFAFACHWLGRAVGGLGGGFGPPHAAMLPCLFLSYQATFLYGYLNFSAGLALAILTLALRIGWAGRWTIPRVAGLTLLTTAVFVSHLAALAILGLGWALWSVWELQRFPENKRRWWAAASLTAFLPAALLYLWSRGQGSSGSILWASPTQKVLHFLGGFTSYSMPVTLVAIVGAGGALVLALWLSRRTLLQPAAAAAALFTGLYLAAPDAFHNATDTDTRFVAIAFLFFAAACSIPARAVPSPALLLGLALAALTVRQIDILRYWREADAEWTRQLPSLDIIPAGAVVQNIVWLDPDPAVNKRQRHFVNFAALAVARRQAALPQWITTPKGTWPLSAQPYYSYRFLGSGEPVSRLDWPRLRAENAYFWTYGLTPAALADMAAQATPIYQSGPVHVFRAGSPGPLPHP